MERLIRRSPEEKLEIIHLVEHSNLSVKQTLAELDVPRSTFYRWYQQYQEDGPDGLRDQKPNPRQFWNRIPDPVKDQVVEQVISDNTMQTGSLLHTKVKGALKGCWLNS